MTDRERRVIFFAGLIVLLLIVTGLLVMVSNTI